MIADLANGRLITSYVQTVTLATLVQPFQVDFRTEIGWLENRRWMLVEIGAYAGGNEQLGLVTVAQGSDQVATALLPFGQLGFDAAGVGGAGFSRSASRTCRVRLPGSWDGTLSGVPQLRLAGGLAGSWSTNQAPIVWVTIQRLRQRGPPDPMR